jgi:hypothetical protein
MAPAAVKKGANISVSFAKQIVLSHSGRTIPTDVAASHGCPIAGSGKQAQG